MDTYSVTNCSLARAANLIGDEWIILILRELFQRPQKFDELQKKTGAATNILSKRLSRMIAYALIVKIPYQERPPRYVYRLTKAGLALLPVTLELMRYAEEWMPTTECSTLQLRHLGCGKLTRPGQVCSECGEPITIRSARLETHDAVPSVPLSTNPTNSAEIPRV